MRRRLHVLASSALALAGLALACIDFDATTRGGPLVPEGGAPDAGVADTGPPSPVEAGAFCAAQDAASPSFFCDDFDENTLPFPWSYNGHSAGTMALTDASFVSSPYALQEQTDSITALPIDVTLRKQNVVLPSPPSHMVFAFEVEPVAIDTSPAATIILAAIDFLDANKPQGRYTVQLSVAFESGAIALALAEESGLSDGGAPFQNHLLPATLPSNQWTHVILELDWESATSLQGIVTIGTSQPVNVPLAMTLAPADLQFSVGTTYVSTPSNGWTLRYDDVLFTTL
jgi:hypothetical protein